MLVLAISAKGKEFLYKAESAHKVSKASGEKIADALNKAGYMLKDGETWYLHTVDPYTNAYYYAEGQEFTVYRGSVRRRYC